MSDYFKVKRPGLISTFQDLGRKNFYHIGLPFSGVMDRRNFKIANRMFKFILECSSLISFFIRSTTCFPDS